MIGEYASIRDASHRLAQVRQLSESGWGLATTYVEWHPKVGTTGSAPRAAGLAPPTQDLRQRWFTIPVKIGRVFAQLSKLG